MSSYIYQQLENRAVNNNFFHVYMCRNGKRNVHEATYFTYY